MNHSFNVDIAAKYGVNCAVLLNNFEFWIAKNKANGQNYFDGEYWTYNSKKAFSELFPYMNARQIDYALKKLIDDDVIKTGNYNKSAYDRTLWYAITKKGYSILQNCEMEETKMENGSNEIVQPIPYIKPTIKQSNNKPNNKQEERKKASSNYDAIISELVVYEPLKETIYEFIKMRKLIKKPLTDFALKKLINKLYKLSSNPSDQVAILEKSIVNNWQDVYELKADNKGKQQSGGIMDDYYEMQDVIKNMNSDDLFGGN